MHAKKSMKFLKGYHYKAIKQNDYEFSKIFYILSDKPFISDENY